jgi:predicted NAD/FAD-binding protein
VLLKPWVTSHSSGHDIAVIGSGIAGLSAAWLLSQRHDVTLFEKESWVGGHTNTIDLSSDISNDGGQPRAPVDTGFMVYNELNYPNLTGLFRHLGVATKPSDMSLSVSVDGGRFEYGTTTLNQLVGQRRNIVRPRFLAMLRDILRFYKTVPLLLDHPSIRGVSLGDYLDRESYSPAFADDHILPMSAAIWSTTPDRMRQYPLIPFIRFFVSHQLFNLGARVQWRTVAGGSREYVARLTEKFRSGLRIGLGVRKIARRADSVLVEDQHGTVRCFKHVVIATHADQALALLDDPDTREKDLLGAFQYTTNRTVLHSDPALMPRRKRLWSSWNFIGGKRGAGGEHRCVTYWMNRLQGIDPKYPLFVTLNPFHEPRRDLLHREFTYEHPYFDEAALQAQRHLPQLQGRRNTWFCGSYFGYGFHEDALQSGLAVGEDLGCVRRPWNVPHESNRIAFAPREMVAAE